MKKINILITGVAGLIGSRMADWIIENKPGYQIIGIDDLSGGYIEYVNSEVIFYKKDIKEDLDYIFQKHKPDYVYHFAAYAAEGLSSFIRQFNYQNNLVATANIVNNCIKYDVKRLIFTSTMAVYGSGNPPFDEDLQPKPIDPYGVAKFACETDIKIAGEQHGLDWCIIRPHNVYGKNQNIWDKYRNVLGIWMNQHMNGKPMTIFGDGEQTRAFSYIDDCLEPFWKCAVNDNTSKQIINIGGTKFYSINQANQILREVIEGGEVVYKEERHEAKHCFPTYQKSVDLLDYKDTTTLREGLAKMWEWAQLQPKRETFIWDKYELEKGIYSFWKS
jgi:UDP-glucose 4-epimerase